MAIAFVNSTSGINDGGASSTSIAATAASHTAGNLLVVGVCWYHTTATASVTDTAGNTYTAKTVIQQPGNEQLQLFYAYNITGNGSNVVTATFSSSCPYRFILVEQYSGILATDPFDVEGNAFDTANATTATSATFTTTQADALIFACVAVPNSGAMTQGAGYTLRQQPSTSSVGDEDKIVSAIQTGVTATMTWANASRWSMALAVFKAGTGGGGGGGGSAIGSRSLLGVGR